MTPLRKPVAAATAAAAVTVAVIVATAGGQTSGGRTITLSEVPKGASFGFVDSPPKTRFTREGEPRKLSPGDLEVLSITVADSQGVRVGRLHAYCVVTRRGVVATHEEECTASYRLGDGTITASDAFVGSESTTWTAAIVGGTGAYEGARGTLTSVANKDASHTDTLRLVP